MVSLQLSGAIAGLAAALSAAVDALLSLQPSRQAVCVSRGQRLSLLRGGCRCGALCHWQHRLESLPFGGAVIKAAQLEVNGAEASTVVCQ